MYGGEKGAGEKRTKHKKEKVYMYIYTYNCIYTYTHIYIVDLTPQNFLVGSLSNKQFKKFWVVFIFPV